MENRVSPSVEEEVGIQIDEVIEEEEQQAPQSWWQEIPYLEDIVTTIRETTYDTIKQLVVWFLDSASIEFKLSVFTFNLSVHA